MFEVLVQLASTAVFVLAIWVGFRSLSNLGGKPLPDLAEGGGRIPAVGLKTFTKGGSAHFGFGDRQSGGYVEVDPAGLRSGSLVACEASFDEIRSVTTKPFGLTRIVVIEFEGDVKSLAATLRKNQVPRLLNYLQSHGASVSES